ncbi:helix-turn-helix domain-containing protein [Anaerobacillus alkalilacustris]
MNDAGHSYKEIANMFDVHSRTVSNYVRKYKKKNKEAV